MQDVSGNKIVNVGGNIFLYLASGGKRLVGELLEGQRVLRVTRKRGKHLLRKANAYGFNHFILSNAKKFDTVLLVDDFGAYRIPRQYILEHGEFLWFKEQGFEKQIFLTLDKIIDFK